MIDKGKEMMTTMRLSELLSGIYTLPADVDRIITGMSLDSRQIQQGNIFFAVAGTKENGLRFISQAISKGALAVLVEGENAASISWQDDVPCIQLPQLKEKLFLLGSRFYGNPASQLKLIGVTGTNGKTSCSHFIAESLSHYQKQCGIIGTLGTGFYGKLVDTGLTTPDVMTIQKTLHSFVTAGAEAVVMEVSSHSIDQGRIAGLAFEIGIFTNLTQDHLDYHGTMEAYAAVKYRYLSQSPIKHLVINIDDHYGALWAETLAESHDVYTYSVENMLATPKHTYCESVSLSAAGISAFVHTPFGRGELSLSLMGGFNLSNALASLVALCLYGLTFDQAVAALRAIHPVPGRMQTLVGQGGPLVVVDYSHTPDALEKALLALRNHTAGRLICLFGCGGNRDAAKRPLMAKIAESFADMVIVTNDNPRNEEPDKILNDIMQGFANREAVIVELDRAKAIQKSIQLANERDCVLIAGKGAEQYQQIGDQKIPFSDQTEAEKCLNEGLI